MSNTLDHIKTYLAAVSPTLGSLYTTEMPESPDACMSILSYAGRPAETGFGVAGIQYENPGVQLKTRGVADDEDGPHDTLYRAYKELAKVQAVTLSGVRYLWVSAQQAPYKLEVDGAGRIIYCCNFICRKEPS